MPLLRPISYGELLRLNIPPQEWLIQDLIPKRTLVLLSAREKSGKGFLTIDAGVSVAMGVEFLNRKTQQGKVIYLAAEESIEEVKSRLQARIPEGATPPFDVIVLDGSMEGRLDLTVQQHVQELVDCVRENEPDLLIVDVLREVHTAKEDSSDEMGPVMQTLRSLCRQFGTTVIVNHHMSKAGGSRGSTAIQGGADVVFELHSGPDSFEHLGGTLVAKGRGVPKLQMSIQFDGVSRWEVTSAPASRRRPPMSTSDIVLEALRATDKHLSVADLATATGIQTATIGNAISQIKRDSPNFLSEEVGPGKGSPRLYKVINATSAA